jgi:hypothetical protein
MPSEDSWIAQRGACVIIIAIVSGMKATRKNTAAPTSQAPT